MKFLTTRVFGKFWNIFQLRKYRQIVLYGGSRSSKTYSLMQGMVIEMMKRPRLRITAWRNEKVTCRATVMEDFRTIVQSDLMLNKIFVENKAKGTFTNIKNGAVILFEGADSISKVLGLHQHISIFNEITEFAEAVYLQITQRTEEIVFADYNPSKKFWFQRMTRREDTIFIHSNFQDNPFLAKGIVKQLLSYEPWEPNSYFIDKGVPMFEKDGKVIKITKENEPPPHPVNVEEGTADRYMWLVYGLGVGAEKPNKIYYGWEYMSGQAYDELPYEEYFGLDFGASNPSAMLGVKYDGDRTLFVDEKLYQPMTTSAKPIETHAYEIAGSDTPVVGDSAKKIYIERLRKAGVLAYPAIKGADSVNPGIEMVQYFNIYLTSRSENVDEEYSAYSWEVDRYGKPTDKPIKKDDHAMDALRYVVTWLVGYRGIEIHSPKSA